MDLTIFDTIILNVPYQFSIREILCKFLKTTSMLKRQRFNYLLQYFVNWPESLFWSATWTFMIWICFVHFLYTLLTKKFVTARTFPWYLMEINNISNNSISPSTSQTVFSEPFLTAKMHQSSNCSKDWA